MWELGDLQIRGRAEPMRVRIAMEAADIAALTPSDEGAVA